MLLIHGNKVIKELARQPQLPLGLPELHMDTDRSIYRTLPHSDDGFPAYTGQMEPGDRMLLYTDGVTEGRAADGSRFGMDAPSCEGIFLTTRGIRRAAEPTGTSRNESEKRASRWGPLRTAEILGAGA
jgi:hypothetical protein